MDSTKHYELTKFLAKIPRKIVGLHGRENITEFVLHDLASKPCFNLQKVTYLVDNPDFDHLKGVAGYLASQSFENAEAIWENVDTFSNHMSNAPFNQKVRKIMRQSPKRGCLDAHKVVDVVAQELDMIDPHFLCWPMRHENHGLLVYEHANGHDHWHEEDLYNGVQLLSLCPIF